MRCMTNIEVNMDTTSKPMVKEHLETNHIEITNTNISLLDS